MFNCSASCHLLNVSQSCITKSSINLLESFAFEIQASGEILNKIKLEFSCLAGSQKSGSQSFDCRNRAVFKTCLERIERAKRSLLMCEPVSVINGEEDCAVTTAPVLHHSEINGGVT